jgi:acyl carrier protein
LSDLLEDIRQAFREAFDIAPGGVSMDTVMADIKGWDSVGHLRLASSLENVFGIILDVDELTEIANVRDIATIIESKTSAARQAHPPEHISP